MDNFFLGTISFVALVALVALVAIVGIVVEKDEQKASMAQLTQENIVGYDIYMHAPRGSNNIGRAVEHSTEYDFIPNRVGNAAKEPEKIGASETGYYLPWWYR